MQPIRFYDRRVSETGKTHLDTVRPAPGKHVRFMGDVDWCDEAAIAREVARHKPPAAREREEHNRTHLPFRPWCKHCVFGRAKNDPHLRDKGEKSEVPIIHWDYAYLKENPHEGPRPAEVIGDGLPILVAYDETNGIPFASMIPNKGECEYAIKRGAQDVAALLGYKKAIFRSDQESSLKLLLDKVSSVGPK